MRVDQDRLFFHDYSSELSYGRGESYPTFIVKANDFNTTPSQSFAQFFRLMQVDYNMLKFRQQLD